MVLLLLAAATTPARADCPAAPIADPNDMAISFLAANGVQAASASLLASSVKEGMLVYDDTANELKVCDGTNWVDVGSGGTDTLASLSCANGEIAKYNGTAWVCAETVDPDQVLQGNGGDIYFNNVTLLLPMNGANASNTFSDASTAARTVTPIGNAQISTAQSKFGGASGLFDGTGDGISIPDTADMELANGNFTIEMWFRPANITAGMRVLAAKYDYGSYGPIGIYQDGSTISMYASSTGASHDLANGRVLATGIAANTWHHLAFVRNGTSWKTYLNGNETDSFTSAASLPDMATLWRIGTAVSNYHFNGHIDDVRITKGLARYTANFTPPSSAHPTLLYQQSFGTDTLSGLSCSSGEIAKYNGTAWACAADGGGSSSSIEPPRFSAYRSGNQTVATNTPVKILFNTEEFDSNNNFDTATGRFTPTVAGTYMLLANAYCADSTTWCQVRIYRNGSEVVESGSQGSVDLPTTTALVSMNGTTDYAEAYVYNGGGTTLGGAAQWSRFSGFKVGGGADTLAGLSCASGEIPRWSGTAWACAADGSGSAGSAPSFFAHRNGVNQTVTTGTATKLVFTHETFDTANNFDTTLSRFTPNAAGTYQLNAMAKCTNTNTYCIVFIYKNGVAITDSRVRATLGDVTANASVAVAANGTTDYFEAAVYVDGTVINGGTISTNFSGGLLGGGGSDTLSGLSCATNEIPKWNGSTWACAADGGGSPGGNILGVSTSRTLNTVYQAAADIWVVASCTLSSGGNANGGVLAKVGATSTPATVISSDSSTFISGSAWVPYSGLSFPVKQGQYWKIEPWSTSPSCAIAEYPLTGGGSGGGGTATSNQGYVQIAGASGAFADSGTTAGEQFFWDNTNKRLGIGTATIPSPAKVNVYGGYLQLGNASGASNDVAVNWMTLGGSTTMIGQSGAKGWTMTARTDGWSSAPAQNDLGLYYWNGTTWTTGLTVDSVTGALGIGVINADASARLQVDSTTQGFLPPRMTAAERNAIASPATGLVVYDTDLNSLYVKTASAWQSVGSSNGTPVAFMVSKNANQSIASGSTNLVTWPTEEYDPANSFASNRFTAPVAGLYSISAQLTFTTTSTWGMIWIYKNGVPYRVGLQRTSDPYPMINTLVNMNAGDYLEVWSMPNGGTPAVYGVATYYSYFQGFLVNGGGGGGSSVAGSDKQIQFNDNGALAGASDLTWDKTTGRMVLGSGGPPEGRLSVAGVTGNDFGIQTQVDGNGRGIRILTNDYANGTTGSSLRLLLGAATGDTYSVINAVKTGNAAAADLVLNNSGGGVSIGATPPDATAALDVISTTKGFLPPRMTTAQRDAIASPAEGLVVYNSTTKSLDLRVASSWLSVGGSMTGNTMVTGWPDAIICNVTNPDYSSLVFYLTFGPHSNGSYYYRANVENGIYYALQFNSSGAFTAYQNITTTTNCNTSIAAHYAAGRAFNFVGGGTASADGTAGQIQFNQGGNLKADAGLHWDNVNKRLGIGTATPLSKLHVAGTEADIALNSGDANLVALLSNYNRAGSRQALYFNHDGAPGYNDLYLGSAFEIVDGVSVAAPTFRTAGSHFINPNILSIGHDGFRFLRSTAATIGTSFTPAESMRITTAGNVGIGTTAPRSKLSVYGSGQVTANIDTSGDMGNMLLVQSSNVALGDGGGITFGTRTVGGGTDGLFAAIKSLITSGSNNSAGDLAFSTRTTNADATLTEKMRVVANGNVGIGTTSPAEKLHINDGTVLAGNNSVVLTGRYSTAFPTTSAATGYFQLRTNNFDQSNGGLSVHTLNAGTLGERIRVDKDGNVGIGTTSPNRKLEIMDSAAGQIRMSYSSDPTYYREIGRDNASSGAFFIKRAQGGAAVQDFTIDISGNVGIGTSAPNAKLTISNNVGDGTVDTYGEYQILLYDNGSAITSYGLAVKSNNLVLKSGGGFAFHGNAGTSIATINSSGTYAASDRNLKQDIATLGYGLAAVMKLKPASYHLKEDPGGPRHIGFIAQDVKKVVPEVVIGDEGQMQLAYPSLVPVLTKAIQELKADNDNLRAEHAAEISALKADSDSLRAQLKTVNDNDAAQDAALDDLRREIDALKAAR